MNDVTNVLKTCVGKVLKSVKEDPKTNAMILEFEDGSLNTRVNFVMKANSFLSSGTTVVKKTKPSLKAKEDALGLVTDSKSPLKSSKKKKPITKSNLTEM